MTFEIIKYLFPYLAYCVTYKSQLKQNKKHANRASLVFAIETGTQMLTKMYILYANTTLHPQFQFNQSIEVALVAELLQG